MIAHELRRLADKLDAQPPWEPVFVSTVVGEEILLLQVEPHDVYPSWYSYWVGPIGGQLENVGDFLAGCPTKYHKHFRALTRMAEPIVAMRIK